MSVVVTASYKATEPPVGYLPGTHTAVQPQWLFGRLMEWGDSERDAISDLSIEQAGALSVDVPFDVPLDEPLLVATVVYEDAEPDAARARFVESTLAFGLPEPETVLAAADLT